MPCVDCPYSSEDSNWCDKVGGEHYAYGWCYDRESSARNTRRVRHKSSRTRAEPAINDKIMDIISEELNEYFAGIRSAEDAAKIIDNRVSVMYNEQK